MTWWRSAASRVSNAIQMAIGIVKNWAAGKGNVDANTRAAAAKAVAQWETLKAKAAGKRAGGLNPGQSIRLPDGTTVAAKQFPADDGEVPRQGFEVSGSGRRVKHYLNADDAAVAALQQHSYAVGPELNRQGKKEMARAARADVSNAGAGKVASQFAGVAGELQVGGGVKIRRTSRGTLDVQHMGQSSEGEFPDTPEGVKAAAKRAVALRDAAKRVPSKDMRAMHLAPPPALREAELQEANAGFEALVAKLVAAGIPEAQAQAVAAKNLGGGGATKGAAGKLAGAKRGSSAGGKAAVVMRRQPNGKFAPAGQGQILKKGDAVSVPHKSEPGVKVPGEVTQVTASGLTAVVKLHEGPDAGKPFPVLAENEKGLASPPKDGGDVYSTPEAKPADKSFPSSGPSSGHDWLQKPAVDPDLGDSPGRRPNGNPRNFKAMNASKLIPLISDLDHYGKDPELLAHAIAVAKDKGFSVPSKYTHGSVTTKDGKTSELAPGMAEKLMAKVDAAKAKGVVKEPSATAPAKAKPKAPEAKDDTSLEDKLKASVAQAKEKKAAPATPAPDPNSVNITPASSEGVTLSDELDQLAPEDFFETDDFYVKRTAKGFKVENKATDESQTVATKAEALTLLNQDDNGYGADDPEIDPTTGEPYDATPAADPTAQAWGPNKANLSLKDMPLGTQFEMNDGQQYVLHKPVNDPFLIIKPAGGGKAKPMHKMFAPPKVGPVADGYEGAGPASPTPAAPAMPEAGASSADLMSKLSDSVGMAASAKAQGKKPNFGAAGDAVAKATAAAAPAPAGGGAAAAKNAALEAYKAAGGNDPAVIAALKAA
jgi:hypothetical protein